MYGTKYFDEHFLGKSQIMGNAQYITAPKAGSVVLMWHATVYICWLGRRRARRPRARAALCTHASSARRARVACTPTVNTLGIHAPPCMHARADFAKSAIWRRGWT
eukprot:COSAG02_NODE_42000_length_388_cov_32.557093_1_plen_105_part_01